MCHVFVAIAAGKHGSSPVGRLKQTARAAEKARWVRAPTLKCQTGPHVPAMAVLNGINKVELLGEEGMGAPSSRE